MKIPSPNSDGRSQSQPGGFMQPRQQSVSIPMPQGAAAAVPPHVVPSRPASMPVVHRSDMPDLANLWGAPSAAYVASQAHLLSPTSENPLPTATPPPIAAVAGTLGDRHVLCLIGLPERGKPFIAKRLLNYLSFFHGADVRLFDLHDYMQRTGGVEGSDEAADLLLSELRGFMESSSNDHAGNLLSVNGSARVSSDSLGGEGEASGARDGAAGGDGVGDGAGGASGDGGDGAGNADDDLGEGGIADIAAAAAVDPASLNPQDRRCKHVDSGKVAIIYSTDSYAAFGEKWAGTSKERRRWAAHTIAKHKSIGAKLIFIEVIVTREEILMQTVLAKQRAQHAAQRLAEGKPYTDADDALDLSIAPNKLRDINALVLEYKRKYVTLQQDRSEDDLSYIKLINYGEQVVTNRMHGYLRMRIAQFLTVIHPTKHTIYLSRHGQSEYNVLGKIGGNPPLSDLGAEYARRLGEWVPKNVCIQHGRVVPCRLWTSSLQRTILTAAHIPHPSIPMTAFGSASVREAHEEMFPLSEAATTSPSPVECVQSWQQMSPRVYRNLDEIFAGEYEGMTYEEIKARAPDEASLRSMDKIGYRYPRGESYFDIISRLDPLVHEIESYKETLMLVSHQAVLRLLYSYLMGNSRTNAPKMEIPLHTVIKITYDGWNPPFEERFVLGPLSGSDGQQNL